MDSTLMTIIGIFLAALLIFVVPLMSITERNDDIAQSVVQTATSEFVDKISNSGVIKPSDYEEYEQKLASTGNTYQIEIEVQHLDENFGKKSGTTSGDLIGENERYSTFTTEILENMYSSGGASQNYVLKKGDNVIVTAKNTNKTTAQTLRTFIYKVTGQGTYQIGAVSSSMVVNDGNMQKADDMSTIPTYTEKTVEVKFNDYDDKFKVRPQNVTAKLSKKVNGIETYLNEIILKDSNNWKRKWDNLSEYEDGAEVSYIINAEDVDYYNETVSYDSSNSKFTITYTLKYNYELSNEKLTWEEAKIECERKGGHLAVISDQEELNFLNIVVERKNYWLGAKDVGGQTEPWARGTWEWVTGEDFDFDYWNRSDGDQWRKTAWGGSVLNGRNDREPDNADSSENYLHVWGTNASTSNWNDADNSGPDRTGCYYICEYDT